MYSIPLVPVGWTPTVFFHYTKSRRREQAPSAAFAENSKLISLKLSESQRVWSQNRPFHPQWAAPPGFPPAGWSGTPPLRLPAAAPPSWSGHFRTHTAAAQRLLRFPPASP